MIEKQLMRVRRLITGKKIDPKVVNTPIGIEVTDKGYLIKCSIHKVSDPLTSVEATAKAFEKQIDHLICYATEQVAKDKYDTLKDGQRVLVKIDGAGPILWQIRWQNGLLGFADLGGKFLGNVSPNTEIWTNI